MEKEVRVDSVNAYPTKSGNTRFVLRDDDGNEYTTFKEPIAREAVAAVADDILDGDEPATSET